ncbi:MAG: hypothetical protein IJC48_10570 [Clostridia bacterium]|nr:hypothetical protein [Clostridia bacterium]MBQ4158176.1 hypothetical protein [Clostridia bacterium]
MPYDPPKKSTTDPDIPPEEMQLKKPGIFISEETMDSLSYRRENGRNKPTMQKKIR